ncbi:carbohydrate ABC transporter permease [Microbacterium rhizosphaerae]|uniref:Sugar ABC transporter permease n=1 Tax=Microbacterium rhizosphaerae TaxID=1678237 RepID=A0ABZ0SKI3_9MICO|nr:sugar ABC transporter permease [Microbacterium rhizosphaerae]WPR89128.1 sugar ABC transporter permease [Microbacterium rhizosphaerae]
MARGTKARTRANLTAYGFSAPYVVLLLAFGILPTAYAIYESFADLQGGRRGFDLSNYVAVLSDFRFWPAVGNVMTFMVIWIPIMLGGSLLFALLLHERVGRASGALRLIYFLPGAVTGSAAVLLWYFMLQPDLSPFAPLLHAMGWHNTNDVFTNAHLPFIFATIAFMTGVGSWIVIMFGALQAIDLDVIEAARVDGAGPIRIAMSIKLPLIGKYIVYMLILCFAGAVQIFVEPSLFYGITQAGSNWWSLNQLGYVFAFQQGQFGQAATVSVILLVVSTVVALLFVQRSRFFQTEAD